MTGVEQPAGTIRAAVSEDLPELRRIFRSASLSNPGDAPLLLARPDVLDFAGEGIVDGRTRVAVTGSAGDGAILGFATVTTIDVGESELDDLFVDPQWQRRGVARRLIDDAVQTLRVSGRHRLWVTGNPHASAFYAAVGFVGSERVATELGEGLRLHLDIR
jgi:GNAT superfamily N-acetyltransferase